jgi:predicted alpha/beta hydrolase family esterase
MMRKKILFIHSAGPQGPDEGSSNLVASLKAQLGADYEVLNPLMPDPDNPEYGSWKQKIENEFNALEGEVVLIGHSLGGSVVLKFLSEEKYKKHVSGLFIVSAPFWGIKDWEVSDYILKESFDSGLAAIQNIFFYHSRADEWVPFEHLHMYAKKVLQAKIRELNGRDHEFGKGIPELVADIRSLREPIFVNR